MDKKAVRVAYGEALVKLGEENEKVVVLDADLAGATMTKFFGGVPFTYSVADWRQMLDLVSSYANECQTVTEAHKAAVQAMTTLADVEAFDITSGYPPHPAF